MSMVDMASMRLASAVLAFVGATLLPGVARADVSSQAASRARLAFDDAEAPPKPTWRARYDRARQRMLDGEYRLAERELRDLEARAETEADRALAHEVADLAKAYADRLESASTYARPQRAVRTTDELTVLYVSSFLYGAGTGAWFLLLTEPDSALTATLPFAAITAAPVLAVATVDGNKKLPRGVPHSISAGLYLGLGEGIWVVGYQHGRAGRIEKDDPNSSVRWKAEGVASVLWGGATLGGVLGGVLGSTLVTTPGRVSFTASTTIWSGTIAGLAAGALLPDDGSRDERAFLVAGAAYNAGLLGGILGASAVSPTVTRVRIADLLAAAGGISASGLYLAVASDPQTRPAEGLAALGAGAGLALGWWVTSGMAREAPGAEPPKSGFTAQPSIAPALGGATLGFAGSLP